MLRKSHWRRFLPFAKNRLNLVAGTINNPPGKLAFRCSANRSNDFLIPLSQSIPANRSARSHWQCPFEKRHTQTLSANPNPNDASTLSFQCNFGYLVQKTRFPSLRNEDCVLPDRADEGREHLLLSVSLCSVISWLLGHVTRGDPRPVWYSVLLTQPVCDATTHCSAALQGDVT